MNDTMSKIIAMATLAIQQGKSLEISIVDKQEEETIEPSLSNEDKALIKQVIVENASKNTELNPEELADSLIRVFKKISLI